MLTLDLPPAVPAAATPALRPAPPLEPLKLTRILVPTDFSEPALKAVHYAVRLAGQFGASLTLLHVFEVPIYAQNYPGYPGFNLPGEDIHRIYDEAQSQAQARLNVLHEQLQPTELVIEHVLRIGTAYTHIIEAAADTKADLIVIATHGYTGLKHLFLGGTAERVVRHAPCPVLVVRENERDFVPNA